MSSSQLAIATTSLTKTFGSVQAVQELSLKVKTGTRFGFLGPNGAGKTTTVRILSGLMKQTTDQGKVCDLDISTQRNAIKAITGLLPESPGVYSKLSAVEFLEFIGALNGYQGASLHLRIDNLLDMLGLEGRQDDLLESYSSGMKNKG